MVDGCFAFLKGLVGNCRALVGKLPALIVFAHGTESFARVLLDWDFTVIADATEGLSTSKNGMLVFASKFARWGNVY
jgi:hypothetical protein